MNSSQSNNMFQQQQQQRTASRLVNELLGLNVISNNSEQQETRMSPLSSSSYTNDSTTNSTTTQSSVAKIIDIQRCRHQKEASRAAREEPDDEHQHCWNSTSTSRNSNQQQSDPGNRWIGARHSQAAGSSSQPQQQNQDLQSGEALSSFESDYDLLVYLGETETEDIVDTERSLDYQDQTWRQSICGGASLAPTIDESLSELINSPQPSRPDFDLLNTPTSSSCPPANPQTYNSLRRPTRSPHCDQQTQFSRGNILDECDHEISLVFNGPTPRARKQQVNSGAQAKRTEEGATSGFEATKLTHCQEESQQVQQKQNIGNRLASLFNRKPVSPQRRELADEDLNLNRNRNRAQVYGEKSRTLGADSGRTLTGGSDMANSRRRFEDSAQTFSSTASMVAPQPQPPKQQLSGVSQSSAAELDRLLAEMSESLDLDSLARFDPHSLAGQRTRGRQEAPVLQVSERSQTLSKFQSLGERRVMPISANQQQNRTAARSVSTNKLVAEDQHPANRSQSAAKSRGDSTMPQRAEQVSCESILDEYDGASRMLEQMISEQLENKTALMSKPISEFKSRKIEDQNVNIVPATAKTRATIAQSTGGDVQLREEAEQEVSRKMSTCSSSMATDTTSVLTAHRVGVSGNPQLESRSVWRHKRPRRRSKASDEQTPELRPDSPPPPPPEVDYTSEEPSVICVEAESQEEVALDAEEPRSQMDRMRRRTMTSMRSMRNKINDLIGGGHNEPRQRQPEPPKRSSSTGSRGSGRAHTPTRPERVEGRESRSKRRGRRPETMSPNSGPANERANHNPSFGQQIRERLSRSKSRLSRFLGGSAKRAQSTPNTKQAKENEQDDSKLFEPGDIARNCEPAKSRDSFDESLERHLAASLEEKKALEGRSSDSSLSGLDTTSVSRSRSKNRSLKKESRPSSLMSLKRFGSMRKQRDLNSEEANGQDLDSMKVSSSSERKRRGNKKPDEDSGSTTSALRAPAIVTTDEYFGQVAPARADSPDIRDDGKLEVGQAIASDNLSLNADGASEMKRPNRSQSMRSFGRQLLSPETAEPKESRQAAASFSNLTLDPAATRGDLRPASGCADGLPDKEVPPTTPVRPSNSPLGGMRLESAKPVQFELARQRHKSPLRTKSSAVLEDIKQRCSGLFGRSADERKSPASLAPVRPPRRRSKSTSHGPESAGVDSDEVIEVQAASPPSTLEREEAAPTGGGGGGGKLVALASQLRHSAADFFHVEPKRNSPNKQERANSPKLPEEEALCEWKPVINSSKKAKVGKETDEQNATSSMQQHSLDTDSTWESSCEDEDVRLDERVDSSAVQTAKSGVAESVDLDLEAEKLFASHSVKPPLVAPVGGGDGRASKQAKTHTFNHSDLQTFGSNKCFLNIEPNNNNNNEDDDQCERQQPETAESVMDAIPLEDSIPEKFDANRATLVDVELQNQLHKLHDPSKQLAIEQRVCKTPFKFNANLPPPTKQRVGGQIDGRRESSKSESKKQSIESKYEDKLETSKETEVAELFSGSDANQQLINEQLDPMAATCAVRALDKNAGRFMKKLEVETGEESHNEQVAEEAAPENRLSVYENVENVEKPKKPALRERHWRRPVWPPASPPADAPAAAEWAVEESGGPMVLKTHAEPERIGLEEKEEVPAKPKRRLVTMTSIIQDPNDELMIPVKQELDKQQQVSAQTDSNNKPAIQRRDSTFSFATTDDNNDSDDDSSYAAAALSRQRIVSKFEPILVRNKQPQPATRPKFPAFAEGKGAWPSSGSGGSVRRLAKNFDLGAQTQTPEKPRASSRPPLAVKPSALGRRLNSPAPESAGSVDEEPASESLWYDANSTEVLDESEVAEFLRDFDCNETKTTCRNKELQTTSVANKLDVCELNANDLSEATGGSVSTGLDPFVSVADSTTEDNNGLRLDEQQLEVSGDDDTLNGEAGDEFNEDDDDEDIAPLSDKLAIENCNEQQVGSSSRNQSPAEHGSIGAAEEEEEVAASEQGKQANSVVRSPRSSNSPNQSISSSNKPADPNDKSCAIGESEIGEGTCLKQSEARGSSDNNQLESSNYPAANFVGEQANVDQLNSKTAVNLPPKPISSNQLIDDNFKNSLNHIIARRSICSTQQVSLGATSGSQTKPDKADMSKAPGSGGCKELKGLTRYYHALLRRGRRHCRRQRKSSDSGASKKPIMTDYIHSSSSSSSSSPASSISGSLCSSPSISDDDEDGSSEIGADNKQSRHLVRAAKKCSRLYEELERILAHRAEKERICSVISKDSGAPDKDNEFADEFEETLSTTTTERDDQISLSSSSVSSESIPEMRQRQNLQKLYHVVNEIYSSEAKFVDTLRLLNEDFRKHVLSNAHQANSSSGSNKCASSSQLPVDCVNNMLKQLPQLQALNENLMSELKIARDQWPKTQKIAHVLVKIGPFLKHYSTYIREFESIQQQFNENMKRYPLFNERVRQFEATDRCQKLTIQHHLLKPIQRIPQYRLLLQQYLHYLKPDDVDYEDTVNALEVVSRVAEHANQAMSEGANFAKLLALQAKIVGKQKDIVQPGRLFVKEGELMKVCRKQIQPRWFILLNDALLYLTQIQSSDILYLNNELPLDDCLISTPSESKQANLIGQQFETEFSVCTRTRSFALIAKSRQERDDWVNTFRRTIDEHLARRRSFEIRRQSSQLSGAIGLSSNCVSQQQSVLEEESNQCLASTLLGQTAPLWTPDSRVTMCQLCTSSFSALFRRHHCRACGRVVCSACSSNKAPLIYLKCRAARVCDQCFDLLKANIHLYLPNSAPTSGAQRAAQSTKEADEMRKLDEHFHTLLRSQFVRHTGLRLTRHAHSGKSRRLQSAGSGATAALAANSERSKQAPADSKKLSRVLKEVGANDSGSIISGYLHRRHQSKAKWKRQWFVIKDKVLYAYRAIDDVAAISSLPLLGYSVAQPAEPVDGLEPKSLLRLSHTSGYHQRKLLQPEEAPEGKRKLSSGSKESAVLEHLFKAESVGAAERWLEAFRKSVVLEEKP